jgi:DNA-binding NtrC family response regulator
MAALSAADAISKFAALKPDIIFLDYRIGQDDGIGLLERFRAMSPDVSVVMMTGHGDVGIAVRAMKSGARDFLTKPVPLSTVAALIVTHARQPGPRPSLVRPSATRACGAAILGRSAAIDDVRRSIGRIANAVTASSAVPPPVLITGESGTGKELVARALHESGPRARGPFVAVNCASLPSELVESELFGHEKGAFTDAKAAKPGLFEAAHGGVLFLDEVGDMPPDAQAKLLRVLENRAFRRVGSLKEQQTDVWVIAATNRNLAERAAQGTFRSDLMFRLQVLWVDLPSLRERGSDVLMLAEHFLAEAAARYGRPVPALSKEARAALVGHSWPGNVRELRNVMERALLINDADEIGESCIQLPETSGFSASPAHEDRTLHDVEVSTLKTALSRSEGNVSRAAGLLGISRDTLRYRMQKFGLGRNR